MRKRWIGITVTALAMLALGCGGDGGGRKKVAGRDIPRPVVHIEQPGDGTMMTAAGPAAAITVSGTAGGGARSVRVRGLDAMVVDGRFQVEGVPLREGENLIIAEAVGPEGGTGRDMVRVTVDRTAPIVSIRWPGAGADLAAGTVTVVGGVRDLYGRTPQDVTVSVNGVAARVSNQEFVAVQVPVGTGDIVATARDSLGNQAQAKVAVLPRPAVGQRIRVVGGDGAHAAPLAEVDPLTVVLEDDQGRAMAGRRVRFVVERGDGLLLAAGGAAREATVVSGADGRAALRLRLGSRAGVAANLVRASADGFGGEALFVIATDAGAAAKLIVERGDNQRGAPGERLAKPLVVRVLDAQGNPAAGAMVEFRIVRGAGVLGDVIITEMPPPEEGQATLDFVPPPTGETAMVVSDGGGLAETTLELGDEEGLGSNQVAARLVSVAGSEALFQAHAIFPGYPEETRVSGNVVNMYNEPIAGVSMRLVEAVTERTLRTSTDAQGRFAFAEAPTGFSTIFVEPSRDLPDGPYPVITYEMIPVVGRDNRIERPIYLPRLDAGSTITVSETQGGVLKMADMPGVELEILPGSARFAGGGKSGTLTLTQVNAERVPMSPPAGASPRLVGALQPTGTSFDPPAIMRYPNLDGLAPGSVLDLMSFDHEVNRFVTVGTGQVTPDGNMIVAESGQGLTRAGWHFVAPPPPPPTKAKNCEPPKPEDVCPPLMPGTTPEDPMIPSKSKCRGACGSNCDWTACESVKGPGRDSICMPSADSCGNPYKVECKYPVQECGTHAGCREHDQCYDDCSAGVGACFAYATSTGTSCWRCCDGGCLNVYGTWQCTKWAEGYGVYDGNITYSGKLSSKSSASKGSCP